jgi:hypothetical protein
MAAPLCTKRVPVGMIKFSFIIWAQGSAPNGMAPGRRRAGGELCAKRPARASARARPEHLASIDLESILKRAPQA